MRSKKAFTVIELILSLVLGGMIMTTMTLVVGNFFGTFPFISKVEAGTLLQSPAYKLVGDAVTLQERIQTLLDDEDTDAVYVLGGNYESQAGDPGLFSSNIENNYDGSPINDLANLDTATFSVNSSTAFRHILEDNASTEDEFDTDTVANASDFTIFFIQEDDIAAMIKVRVEVDTDPDGMTTFEVSYEDNIGGSPISYSYQDTTSNYENHSVSVGASHIWLRTLDTWHVKEELGCVVIFPDPTASSTINSEGQGSFSRYTCFLPVKL